MKLRGIIFDCDGVLVDSEHLSAQVWTEMLAERGFDTDLEYVHQSMIGGSIDKALNIFTSITKEVAKEEIEKEYRKKVEFLFENELKEIPGVRSILEKLLVPRSVASNGPLIKIHANLKITGLNKYFDQQLIFSGHEIQKFKPEPDLFLLACNQMRTPKEQCIVIEDSTPGVLAALNAGIEVIHYSAQGPLRQELEVPSFASMAQIERYLNERL